MNHSRSGDVTLKVHDALRSFDRGVRAAVTILDESMPPGARQHDEQRLLAVASVAAELHGEWIRIHPFANGNGRTARIWANVIALRYGLPAFVSIKPRPGDVAYARAARTSMGRPPGFTGAHDETIALFVHLLAGSLA